MGSTQAAQPLKVLVIGAGSAGLLMAQVFKKAGIEVTVFEQDASPTARQRDWDFGIYWAQSRIEECLTQELSALVDTVQTDPSYRRHERSVLPVYNGITRELLKDIPAPYAIRLRRRAWLDLIQTGVDVRYGKKLESIATSGEGVAAMFADGTVESGSLLIGCEGAHSVTRQWLFAHNPQEAALRDVPISSFVALAKLEPAVATALRALHPTYSIILNPSGCFTWYSAHDCSGADPAEWVFMILMTWPLAESEEEQAALAADSELLLEKARQLAKPLEYPFGAMVRGIPRGTKAWYCSRVRYWPTKPWDNKGGRVTLAGDAAHPMTFHRGQGLGHAISDAAELQTHLRAMKGLTREELAGAVDKYEKDVWQRGRVAVEDNVANTMAVHDWETMTQSPLLTKGLKKVTPAEDADRT